MPMWPCKWRCCHFRNASLPRPSKTYRSTRERFFVPDKMPFSLEPRDPVLYFLQRLRDEAHRFAIGTHRTRRAGDLTRSALDEVPG